MLSAARLIADFTFEHGHDLPRLFEPGSGELTNGIKVKIFQACFPIPILVARVIAGNQIFYSMILGLDGECEFKKPDDAEFIEIERVGKQSRIFSQGPGAVQFSKHASSRIDRSLVKPRSNFDEYFGGIIPASPPMEGRVFFLGAAPPAQRILYHGNRENGKFDGPAIGLRYQIHFQQALNQAGDSMRFSGRGRRSQRQ